MLPQVHRKGTQEQTFPFQYIASCRISITPCVENEGQDLEETDLQLNRKAKCERKRISKKENKNMQIFKHLHNTW